MSDYKATYKVNREDGVITYQPKVVTPYWSETYPIRFIHKDDAIGYALVELDILLDTCRPVKTERAMGDHEEFDYYAEAFNYQDGGE